MIELNGLKLITEPSVYLIGEQKVNQDELNRFLNDHQVVWDSDSQTASEVLSEIGGRVCYMSFAKPRPGGNKAYLHHIKEVGHGSVLEHGVYTFIFTGISRSLTHELVRHRAGFGFSQLSQRYVDESTANYVIPPELLKEIRALKLYKELCSNAVQLTKQFSDGCLTGTDFENYTLHDFVSLTHLANNWVNSLTKSHDGYCKLVKDLLDKLKCQFDPNVFNGVNPPKTYMDCEQLPSGKYKLQCPYCSTMLDPDKPHPISTDVRKAARQAARSVLPNAVETKITVTANVRSLRHFIEQRGSRQADVEIRRLANHLFKVLIAEAPNLFDDYQTELLKDGTYAITTRYQKV